jgi:Uncharacterised protein family UPF0102
MPATESKKQLGVRGEDLACAELERQGMQVLERNWRCRLGEIEIVVAETGEEGVTRTAGVELGPHGIHMVNVCPGAVATPITIPRWTTPRS